MLTQSCIHVCTTAFFAVFRTMYSLLQHVLIVLVSLLSITQVNIVCMNLEAMLHLILKLYPILVYIWYIIVFEAYSKEIISMYWRLRFECSCTTNGRWDRHQLHRKLHYDSCCGWSPGNHSTCCYCGCIHSCSPEKKETGKCGDPGCQSSKSLLPTKSPSLQFHVRQVHSKFRHRWWRCYLHSFFCLFGCKWPY